MTKRPAVPGKYAPEKKARVPQSPYPKEAKAIGKKELYGQTTAKPATFQAINPNQTASLPTSGREPDQSSFYNKGSSETDKDWADSKARRRNAPYFSWENSSGERVPVNSAEAVQIIANSENTKYGIKTTAEPMDTTSQGQNKISANDVTADDWKTSAQLSNASGQNDKMFSPYDAENPVVSENPKKRTDVMDIRQRLRKCFRVVHSLLVASGASIVGAGGLLKYFDNDMLGKLDLRLNESATKLYFAAGGTIIVIAALAQLILSFKKFKILTWLIYLLIICIAASCAAACSFSSLRSYKNHSQARKKLFTLMNTYNGKNEATEKWDTLHQQFECCGIDNFMDWTDYPYGRTSLRTPMSCCRNFKEVKDLYCGQNLLPRTDMTEANQYVYAQGCIQIMMRTADIWYISTGIITGFITIFMGFHWLFCFFLITSHRA